MNQLHAYLITDGEAAFASGLKLANYLRSKVHGLRLLLHCGGGNIKNQFKKADKSGAQYAIIIGEHELKTHSVSLKSLREDIPQQTLYQDELAEYLKLKISKKDNPDKHNHVPVADTGLLSGCETRSQLLSAHTQYHIFTTSDSL